MLSGFYGTGHATTTYGGNIGAIGMTKVHCVKHRPRKRIFFITRTVFDGKEIVFCHIYENSEIHSPC